MALRGVSRERSPEPGRWGSRPEAVALPAAAPMHARVPRPSLALVPHPWCDQDPQRVAVSAGPHGQPTVLCLSVSQLVRKAAEHQLRGFGGK